MEFKKALLHNFSWKIAGMLLTFLNNLIIVRILGAEDSGPFFYSIAIFTLFSTVIKLGIENGIVFIASRYPEKSKALFVFLLLLIAVQIFVVWLVVSVFRYEKPIGSGWIVSFIIANTFFYYITAFFQAQKRFISINIINTMILALQLVFFSLIFWNRNILFVQNDNNIGNIFSILTLFTVVQMIILSLWYLKGSNGPVLINDLNKTVSELFKFSGVNYLITIIFFLITRADFYFIEKYCSQQVLGNYTQIARLSQMALVIPGLLGGVLFPYSINSDESFKKKILFICRIMTAVSLVLFACILVFGKQLFPWLLGYDFTLVYPGFAAIFPGVFCMSLSLLFVSYFEGVNKQKYILYAYLLTLIIIIVADLVFVHRYGFIAASIIFSAANFIGMMVLISKFRKNSFMKISDLLLISTADLKKIKAIFQ